MSTTVAYDILTEVPGLRMSELDDERITAELGGALARLRPAFDPAPEARDRARVRLVAALQGANS
jgi:hypothetical protein